MKNIIMKARTLTGALLLCLMIFSHSAHAQTKLENFAGTWALNDDKSDFGRLTAASATKIKTLQITQTGAGITMNTGDNALTNFVEISLSGGTSRVKVSETISDIPNTLTADIKLEIINKRLFKTSNRDPRGVFALQKRSYTLSEDGKILTIGYEYDDERGEELIAGKLIYDRNPAVK